MNEQEILEKFRKKIEKEENQRIAKLNAKNLGEEKIYFIKKFDDESDKIKYIPVVKHKWMGKYY